MPTHTSSVRSQAEKIVAKFSEDLVRLRLKHLRELEDFIKKFDEAKMTVVRKRIHNNSYES